MDEKLLFEFVAWYIQVLHINVDMQVVLFALVSRHIISPRHDPKAEDWPVFCNHVDGI